MVSGVALSNELNKKITIFWKKDTTLNCDFYELFEKTDFLIIKKFNWLNRLLEFGKTNNKTKRKFSKLIYRLFRIDFLMFDHEFNKYVWSNPDYRFHIETLPTSAKNIYISTCNEFYWKDDFINIFRPKKEILKSIFSITNKFSKKVIGIHIRRTDHLVSINESPLEEFIKTIERELIVEPSMTFFLATDELSVQHELSKKFSSIIFYQKNKISRENCQGIKDALIDLYCLASTNKIYGSFYSSFSEIAARIGKIPLIPVRKN